MRDVLAQLEKDVLRERGVEPAQSADDPRIVVVVRPLSEGASVFDNRVEVTIEQRGQLWSDASWGFDCARCSDGHLLSKVGVMLHSAITRLEEGSRDPVVVEPPEDKGSEDSPEPKVEPPIDDVPKPKPGPLVWAGAATALVGVAGIAVGVPLALREDRIIGDLDSPKRQGAPDPDAGLGLDRDRSRCARDWGRVAHGRPGAVASREEPGDSHWGRYAHPLGDHRAGGPWGPRTILGSGDDEHADFSRSLAGALGPRDGPRRRGVRVRAAESL